MKIKTRIIFEILGFVAGGFFIGYICGTSEQDTVAKTYIKKKHAMEQQVLYDKIAVIDRSRNIVKKTNDSLRVINDSLRNKLDSSYIKIEDLSQIYVSNADKKKALEWINVYNELLK
jgi:hypothetical protein